MCYFTDIFTYMNFMPILVSSLGFFNAISVKYFTLKENIWLIFIFKYNIYIILKINNAKKDKKKEL